jgi:hypothetical protein
MADASQEGSLFPDVHSMSVKTFGQYVCKTIGIMPLFPVGQCVCLYLR